jgi:hypothetical protein
VVLVGLRVAALTKTSHYNLDRKKKERERKREINYYSNTKPDQR